VQAQRIQLLAVGRASTDNDDLHIGPAESRNWSEFESIHSCAEVNIRNHDLWGRKGFG
jgi:hypothetical protein